MNCIIIHGCPPDTDSAIEKANNPETRTFDKHWMPWVKRELERQGIETIIPIMPEPWAPDYEKYKAEFEKNNVDENTILIGHSCGCAFLIRWLGESKRKIKELILVAPWKIPDNLDEARQNFYTYPIDESIKDRTGKIVMFTADDEEPDGKKSLAIFHVALGGKIIELPGRGHYVIGDMKTDKFPELLAEVSN